jgi:hypothetical protein
MNISIIRIESELVDDKQICKAVEVLATASDDETGATFRLSQLVTLGDPGDDFIDYTELTEDIVLDWCYKSLHEGTRNDSTGKEESMYAALQRDVLAGLEIVKRKSSMIDELPWDMDNHSPSE